VGNLFLYDPTFFKIRLDSITYLDAFSIL